MTDFQAQTETFLSWFKSLPGSAFHRDIALVDLREQGEGRGVVATADIPPETELFSIPRKDIINVENSGLSKKLPGVLSTLQHTGDGGSRKPTDDAEGDDDNDGDEEVEDMPNPWLDLILVLIYEYLQGSRSPWFEYLSVLPASFDTLMFWEESELAALQASSVRERIGKSSADEMFTTKVLPVINAHRDVFYPEGATELRDEEVLQLAHRMGSVIMAYAFDLDEDEDDEDDEDEDGWVRDREGLKAIGMVPMADMLNADAEFNVSNQLPHTSLVEGRRKENHEERWADTPTERKKRKRKKKRVNFQMRD